MNAALLSSTFDSSVSTEIPVSCAFAVSNPNRFPVCDASTFHAFMILSTWSTDCVTFVPLIVANCMNCFEVFSSSVPVVWNLVLTSPIASPTVDISSGIVPKALSADFVNPSSASPVAPVFVTMVSYPSSSSLNAAIDAAPMPAIPAETTDIFFPKLSIFVPAVSQAVANFSSLLSFNCSLTFFSSASIFMRAVFDFSVFTV